MFLRLGVSKSYVWGLVFLRFGASNSYVWGLDFFTFWGEFFSRLGVMDSNV